MLLSDVSGECACDSNAAVRLCLVSLVWWSSIVAVRRLRRELGASEQPGRPQVSSVRCSSQESVVFISVRSNRDPRSLSPVVVLLLFFTCPSQKLFQISFPRASLFLISSLMLPSPSSCCLWPGATRRIK